MRVTGHASIVVAVSMAHVVSYDVFMKILLFFPPLPDQELVRLFPPLSTPQPRLLFAGIHHMKTHHAVEPHAPISLQSLWFCHREGSLCRTLLQLLAGEAALAGFFFFFFICAEHVFS